MAVRLILLVLFFGLLVGGAERANADAARTCVFVETVAGLPGDLQSIRKGRGNIGVFKKDLASVSRKIGDNRRATLFTKSELGTMRILLNAVRKDVQRNGVSSGADTAGTRAAIPQDVLRDMMVIVTKFGCKLPKYQGDIPLKGVQAGTVDPLTVILTIAVVLMIILGVLKLMRYGQRDERRICRVPARLSIGGSGYSTIIMNISRGGVMVEAPDTGAEYTEVTLELPGFRIESRVVWTNSNFAGLVFEKKITLQKVEEILRIRPDASLADGGTEQSRSATALSTDKNIGAATG